MNRAEVEETARAKVEEYTQARLEHRKARFEHYKSRERIAQIQERLATLEEEMLSGALDQALEDYMEASNYMMETGVFDTAYLVKLRDVVARRGHALMEFRQREETQ